MDGLGIVFATPRFAPQIGGAETYTLELARALRAGGHQVRVLARAAPGVASGRIGGIEVERLASSRIAFGRALARAIAASPPDAVIAQYAALPFAVRAARRARVPVVALVHDLYGARASRAKYGVVRGTLRYLAIERSLTLQRPDRFIVPSHATALRVREVLGVPDAIVAIAGADHVRAHPGPRDPGHLLFVGRLAASKGVDDLLEVVRRLRATGRDVTAEIVGSGPQEASLRAQAADLGDAVRFAGEIDDAALEEAFGRAGMLVLPSRREGWGLVLTEAAARGVPYVAHDLPAVVEQHALIGGGLVVSQQDGLTDAVASLLDDPARARALGAAGQAATAAMTWQATAEVVAAALRVAIGGVRAS